MEGNTESKRLKANVAIRKADRDSLGRIKPGCTNQLRYRTKSKLAKAIDEYFKQVARDGEVPTMSGMALFLGITRKTLHNYSGRYTAILDMAKARVEASLEQRLVTGQGSSQGVMFSLKQMGWVERQEVVTENKSVSLTGFRMIPPTKQGDEQNS